MKKNNLVVLFIVILFFGIFFLNNSFTGMYVVDFDQETCYSNNDCFGNEMCCKFYDKDYGVCDDISRCKSINDITREEGSPMAIGGFNDPIVNVYKHQEYPSNNMNYLIFGTVLIAISIVGLVYVIKKK